MLLCDLRVHASGHAGGLVNLTSLGVRPAVRLSDPGGLGETALPEPHSCHSFHRAGPRGRFVVWLLHCSGCSIPAVSARPPYLFDAQSVSIRVYLWLAVRLFQRYG